MSTLEHDPMRREVRGAVRATDVDSGGFVARVVTYGVEDSYGTIWAPGVFADDVRTRATPLAWGHSWTEPIGHAVEHWERDDGLDIEFVFDDESAVPRARQARAQVRSGTLTDVSVGFAAREWLTDDESEVVTFTRSDLNEVSLVLRGAVPGAQVDLATVRRLAEVADEDDRVPVRLMERVIRAMHAGEMDLTTALVELGLEDAPPVREPAPDPSSALARLRARRLV